MWLLVVQRLRGGAALDAAVLELLDGLPASFWPRPCKRIRDWQQGGKPLSSNTGAYNQARQRLPLSVVQQSCDRIFQELVARTPAGSNGVAKRAFVLDGSSMRMAHSPAVVQRFPATSNQHGDGHWPVVRVLVAHDLWTGLAMRPEWGAMHGPDAVSEQGLLERAIGRLPLGAKVLGDCNFGVFSVAYALKQAGHESLLRLTAARAKPLAGEPLRDGMDRVVTWKPSRYDRSGHPELPGDASVKGRLIVRQVQPDSGSKPFLLALFTTLSDSVQEVVELYGQRWKIETDLRTLKSELRLDQFFCFTPDMAAKEIEMAIAAYNLVRAVICLASQESGLPPRAYGFSKARRIVEMFARKIAAAKDDNERNRLIGLMIYYVQQAKHPKRRQKRAARPRRVWGKKQNFPVRER